MCPRSPLVEDRVHSVGRILRDIVVPCRVPAQERLAHRAGVVAAGRGRGGAGEAAGAPPEPVVLPDELPGLASLQHVRQRPGLQAACQQPNGATSRNRLPYASRATRGSPAARQPSAGCPMPEASPRSASSLAALPASASAVT